MKISILFLCLFAYRGLLQAKTSRITPQEVKEYIGLHATVCGVVVSSHFHKKSRSEPTFLNPDRPYPDHIFAVVIWEKDPNRFQAPERHCLDKYIRVKGLIRSYKRKAEVFVRSAEAISTSKYQNKGDL